MLTKNELESLKYASVSFIENGAGLSSSSSIIKNENTVDRKGCCSYLTAYNQYTCIIPEDNWVVSKEIRIKWFSEICELFPIKIKEDSILFDGTTEKYGSNLRTAPFYKDKEKIYELIGRVMEDFISERETLYNNYLESIKAIKKPYSFYKTSDKCIKVSTEEVLESLTPYKYIPNSDFVTVFASTVLFIVLAILQHTKLHIDLDIALENIPINNSLFGVAIFAGNRIVDKNTSYFCAHSEMHWSIVRGVSDPRIIMSRAETYGGDREISNKYTKIFFKKFITKILPKHESALKDIKVWDKEVYKISSTKLNSLQCHTLIRAIWERKAEFVLNYFKLKELFPTVDPYLLMSIAGLYQRSAYGTIHDGTNIHCYISGKSRKEIIAIKKKLFKDNISREGVVSSFRYIFNLGTNTSLKSHESGVYSSIPNFEDILKVLHKELNTNESNK